ncbi:MAG: hypothetical protein HYX57_10965 [Chloroflexi bacterium]|nr:hypothetical protein [Chloroflexota bacterium]
MTELLARLLANPLVTSVMLGLGASLLGLWLAGCWWAYQDAGRRSGPGLAPFAAAAWIFLSTPALLPLSVAIYSLVRPQEAAGDRRVRGLLGSLDPRELDDPACPACARPVEQAWRRCPACATWLGLQCDRCDRWAPRDAEICPWCAWVPGEPTNALAAAAVGASPMSVPAASPAYPTVAADSTIPPMPVAAIATAAPGTAVVSGAARRGPAPRAPRSTTATRAAQHRTPGGRWSRIRGSAGRAEGPVEA